MCFATYSVFVFSHAEDLDPEEGEGDVDSQLSGQAGGDIFQFSFQPKKRGDISVQPLDPYDLTLTLAPYLRIVARSRER